MDKRNQFWLTVLACSVVWGLSLSHSVWGADGIVTITDEQGRKIYINAGEIQLSSGGSATAHEPAKAESSDLATPEISHLVEQTANRLQIDPQLVHAIIKVESEYDPKAVSSKGAMGLMQLIPETAQRVGVENPFNPKQNIEGGVSHLKHLLNRYGGDLSLSLAAYNAGEAAVDRYGGIPPFAETKDYVKKVTNIYHLSSPQSGTNAAGSKPPPPPITRYVDERGIVHYSNVE